MKIVLPLLLKRKGPTVDANRSNYDIHGRGLLDISFGSDEDKNKENKAVDPFESQARSQRQPNVVSDRSSSLPPVYKCSPSAEVKKSIIDNCRKIRIKDKPRVITPCTKETNVKKASGSPVEKIIASMGEIVYTSCVSGNSNVVSRTSVETNMVSTDDVIDTSYFSCINNVDTECSTPKSTNVSKQSSNEDNRRPFKVLVNDESLPETPPKLIKYLSINTEESPLYVMGKTPEETTAALAEMQNSAHDHQSTSVDDMNRSKIELFPQQEKRVKISVVSNSENERDTSSNELLKSLTPVFSFLEKYMDFTCAPMPSPNFDENDPFIITSQSSVKENTVSPTRDEQGIEVLLTSYEPSSHNDEQEISNTEDVPAAQKNNLTCKQLFNSKYNKGQRRRIEPIKLNLSIVVEESRDDSFVDENVSNNEKVNISDCSWNTDTDQRLFNESLDGGRTWVESLIGSTGKKARVEVNIEQMEDDQNGDPMLNVSIESPFSEGAWNSGKEDAFLFANDPALCISIATDPSSEESTNVSPFKNITLGSAESKAILEAIRKEEEKLGQEIDRTASINSSYILIEESYDSDIFPHDKSDGFREEKVDVYDFDCSGENNSAYEADSSYTSYSVDEDEIESIALEQSFESEESSKSEVELDQCVRNRPEISKSIPKNDLSVPSLALKFESNDVKSFNPKARNQNITRQVRGCDIEDDETSEVSSITTSSIHPSNRKSYVGEGIAARIAALQRANSNVSGSI